MTSVQSNRHGTRLSSSKSCFVRLLMPLRLPPNCSFEVDDIEKPWMWKEPFDFIHSANLGQGLRDWPNYTQQVYEYV